METPHQIEFVVLRYVPNIVRGEFVNIGLVANEPSMVIGGFADVRFTQDWKRLRCLDPKVDLDEFSNLEHELRGQISVLKEPSALLNWLEDFVSNTIQLSEIKRCKTLDPELELDLLALLYLEDETAWASGQKELTGRKLLHKQMTSDLEQANVLGFMVREFPLHQYTTSSLCRKFDYGCPVKGDMRFFHAISMQYSSEPAFKLATAFPLIREGMANRDKIASMLTVVIEDVISQTNETRQYARRAMQEEGINVVPISGFPAVAQELRQELGV